MSSVVKILQPRSLVLSNCQEFRQEVSELIASKPDYVLINCQDFTFMDESGDGAFVRAAKAIKQSGGQLVFCSLNGQMKMMFELLNYKYLGKFYSDREAFFAETGAIAVVDEKF